MSQDSLTLSLPCFSVQVKQHLQKHNVCSTTTGTPPLESTHQELSFECSHTFRFHWTVQDLEVFYV